MSSITETRWFDDDGSARRYLSNSGDQYIREYIMGKKNSVTGEFEGGKAVLKR